MSTADRIFLVTTQRQRNRRLVQVLAICTVLALVSLCAIGWYEYGKRVLPPSGGIYFVHRLVLPVGLYLQGDARWGQDQIASSIHTIAQVGCAISSAAMVMSFYGIDTDPKRLNSFLQQHNGYDENNDLRWEGPATLAPAQVRHAYEDLPSYHLIDSNLVHGNPVIVRLRLSTGITHFVVIVGKQGFKYLVRDPASAGLRKGVYPLEELGSNIEALRFYEWLKPSY